MDNKPNTGTIKVSLILLTFIIAALLILTFFRLTGPQYSEYLLSPPGENYREYSTLFNLPLEWYASLTAISLLVSILVFILNTQINRFFLVKKKVQIFSLKKNIILSLIVFILVLVFQVIFLNLFNS